MSRSVSELYYQEGIRFSAYSVEDELRKLLVYNSYGFIVEELKRILRALGSGRYVDPHRLLLPLIDALQHYPEEPTKGTKK